jgi:F0F1-type ATP synthase membrane subunit a
MVALLADSLAIEKAAMLAAWKAYLLVERKAVLTVVLKVALLVVVLVVVLVAVSAASMVVSMVVSMVAEMAVDWVEKKAESLAVAWDQTKVALLAASLVALSAGLLED